MVKNRGREIRNLGRLERRSLIAITTIVAIIDAAVATDLTVMVMIVGYIFERDGILRSGGVHHHGLRIKKNASHENMFGFFFVGCRRQSSLAATALFTANILRANEKEPIRNIFAKFRLLLKTCMRTYIRTIDFRQLSLSLARVVPTLEIREVELE